MHPGRIEFYVVRATDAQGLTRNIVNTEHWPPVLRLETAILAPNISPGEAGMLADLEQCTAIAVAAIDLVAL